MVARVICTCLVVGLSIACFLGAGPAPAGLNSAAVISLIGAGFVWFAWPAGYQYRGGETPRRWQFGVTIGASPITGVLFKTSEGHAETRDAVLTGWVASPNATQIDRKGSSHR